MGKIVSLTMSPSKTKIALYDNKGFVYFFSSDLNFESKVLFKINEDFSESEINEQKSIISFNAGYQFLFCGEDAVALSGQRFIFVINQNQMQNTYKIVEGYEMDAIQGTLFSKCISEVDGLRYLTNDGVFFISNISEIGIKSLSTVIKCVLFLPIILLLIVLSFNTISTSALYI